MCDKSSYRDVPVKKPDELYAEAQERKKKLICPHCGKPMVRHTILEGVRFHVHSYYMGPNGAAVHCSEPDCEDNHGPGHCVPYVKRESKEMEFIKDVMR